MPTFLPKTSRAPSGHLERARLLSKTPSVSAWLQAIGTPHEAKRDDLANLENLVILFKHYRHYEAHLLLLIFVNNPAFHDEYDPPYSPNVLYRVSINRDNVRLESSRDRPDLIAQPERFGGT